ncbi:MAG: hypothetical protein WA652_15240, partial [Xanthobacteraceae bacterium]
MKIIRSVLLASTILSVIAAKAAVANASDVPLHFDVLAQAAPANPPEPQKKPAPPPPPPAAHPAPPPPHPA